jgi:hypothetical protein
MGLPHVDLQEFLRCWPLMASDSRASSIPRNILGKGMCFRLLYTLHQCGFLDKVGENHYRLASEVRRRRLYRIGYASGVTQNWP